MNASPSLNRSRVRFSLRWKITLPFMLLALVLGLGATYVLNRLLSETEETRFLRQLADGGQQATDAVVRAEADLLEVLRLVSNTEGVAASAASGNAEDLRMRVLPLVVNSDMDVVTVLDVQGTSLVTVRRSPQAAPGDYYALRGEAFYTGWPFVIRILQGVQTEGIGDKDVGLESLILDEGEVSAFFVGGPIRDSSGRVVGAVLAGRYLPGLVGSLSLDAGANVTIYDLTTGQLLASSLESVDPASVTLTPDQISGGLGAAQQGQSPVRAIDVAGVTYEEVLTPFIARGGTQLGVMGVSLLWAPLERSAKDNLLTLIQVSALALALVVLVGLAISSSITRPLVEMADASAQVATGNLTTHVSDRGGDEIGMLARNFNTMVDGLREGSVYRDLLGRTVTPEVRDQLHKRLVEGEALQDGQGATATVLVADLRGLPSLVEETDPGVAMTTLNEYFSGVVSIIAQHGGMVNTFDGDSIVAFFGILPRPVPPQVSALQATHAGMEMLEFISGLNRDRASRGQPALEMGVGVSTGPVIAGSIGSKDRLHYTVIGDTVNMAQRIQEATLEIQGSGLLISGDTHRYLAGAQRQFEFGRTGIVPLRGQTRQATVHEVQGRRTRLVERPGTGREE
jgi:class 3 adenylate cyclase